MYFRLCCWSLQHSPDAIAELYGPTFKELKGREMRKGCGRRRKRMGELALYRVAQKSKLLHFVHIFAKY